MDYQNGTGRRVFNARPKTQTIAIETIDDGVQSLVGFCKGPSCPISVVIETEAAWDLWRLDSYVPATDEDRAAWEKHLSESFAAGTDPGASPIGDDGRVYRFSRRADLNLRRDMLTAVLPGLDKASAAVLANDDGGWIDILRELEWWAAAPEAEATADPEAAGEGNQDGASSGPISSPNSAPSTALMTG